MRCRLSTRRLFVYINQTHSHTGTGPGFGNSTRQVRVAPQLESPTKPVLEAAMLFPESLRVEFKRNPLKEVICQLRFPMILRLKSEDPIDFQARISADYPEYSDQQTDQDGTVVPVGVNHFFRSKDGNSTISLGPDFVAFSEKAYRNWDVFFREVQRAQHAVEEIYRPTYFTRVGLRYVDVIDRIGLGLKDIPWGEILNPEMLGFVGAAGIGGHVRSAVSGAVIRLGDNLPEGVATVRHGLVKADESNNTYFIDVDFYLEQQVGGSDATNALQRFHECSGNFIRWCFTDRLKAELQRI